MDKNALSLINMFAVAIQPLRGWHSLCVIKPRIACEAIHIQSLRDFILWPPARMEIPKRTLKNSVPLRVHSSMPSVVKKNLTLRCSSSPDLKRSTRNLCNQ